MIQYDVIVIGAGASGAMAALKLSRAGKKVVLLEAQDRLGGRIHTLHDNSFSCPVELGAEFIHGNLPVTIALLQEAGIKFTESGGQFWNLSNGKLSTGFGFMHGWDVLEKRLTELTEDLSVDDFLKKYFSDKEYVGLRNSVKGFVEGYDAADTSRASTLAFRDEWLSEVNEGQYRVEGGYKSLIDYMEAECKKAGAKIHLSSAVAEIKWSREGVEAITASDKYSAKKVVITIPAGILQDKRNGIKFTPAIPAKMKEISTLGFGNAMKVILRFNSAFWKEMEFTDRFGKKIEKLGFLISDAPIPTWWTQLPDKAAMLVGWAAGPNADKFKGVEHETVLQVALDSLAYIFQTDAAMLEKKVNAWRIINWGDVSFVNGGYTYTAVNQHKEILKPVENILYFAGEAFYHGPSVGTVEAALTSGLNVSEEII